MLVVSGVACLFAGCSEGIKEFPCAKVSGVVLCNGQPVPEAEVYFSPKVTGKSAIVGKPGFSWTSSDGSFVLSTYGDGDGAIVGPHIVRVTTSKPCDCVGEETRDLMEVEIKEGEQNEFQIDLPPRPAGAPKSAQQMDEDDE